MVWSAIKKFHPNCCGRRFWPRLFPLVSLPSVVPQNRYHQWHNIVVVQASLFFCDASRDKTWNNGCEDLLVECLEKVKKRFPKWWDLIVIYHDRIHKKQQQNDSRMLMVHQNSEFDLERRFHNMAKYCWWKKSCTSWYGKYPIIYKVSYIPGGAGFLPSTVGSNDFCWMILWFYVMCFCVSKLPRRWARTTYNPYKRVNCCFFTPPKRWSLFTLLLNLPSLKLRAKAPENWWLEDHCLSVSFYFQRLYIWAICYKSLIWMFRLFWGADSLNWWIPFSNWLGSPPFLSHLGHLEGEEPQLGDMVTMVIMHVSKSWDDPPTSFIYPKWWL